MKRTEGLSTSPHSRASIIKLNVIPAGFQPGSRQCRDWRGFRPDNCRDDVSWGLPRFMSTLSCGRALREKQVRVFLMLVAVVSTLTGTISAADAKTAAEQELREPAIAGTWYPGSAGELRRQVMSFLAGVPVASAAASERVVALIAPHAGYGYSGQVAAYAYKQIDGRPFDTVVVVAPSHRIQIGRAQV